MVFFLKILAFLLKVIQPWMLIVNLLHFAAKSSLPLDMYLQLKAFVRKLYDFYGIILQIPKAEDMMNFIV